MRVMPQDTGTLHFIGIGGIGMSGIAEVLHDLGYRVQGSDIADGANVQRLRARGIHVITGHDRANLKDENGDPVSVVVVSSAVPPGNPELEAARAARLPVVRRAEMLAELMRLKHSVVIGGTHGKTTTTSMVGAMLEEGGQINPALDPTVINGGIVNRYGTNTRLGKGDWMVVEADESDGTFTRLPATVAVITNIDPEHMEHYGSFENVRKAYSRFVQNLPFYGYAVLCTDHPEVQALIPELSDRRLVTYGFNAQADVRAANIRPEPGGARFDVTFAGWIRKSNDQVLREVFLPMPGRHNVQNALVALAVGYEMGMDFAALKSALSGFSGVKRRFTKTGEAGGVTVIDDYGHHPVEIAAVLKAARESLNGSKGRIIAVMQPHRYTRLSALFEEFCTCFNDADTVIVADVYEAGEAPIAGANRDALAEGISEHGHRDVRILESAGELPQLVAGMARPGDMVVCLGAGDITRWANALPGELEALAGASRQKSA